MRLAVLVLMILIGGSAMARKVTVWAEHRAAEDVFRIIMLQTGKNFIYDSGLLKNLEVNANITSLPLKRALKLIFKDSDIEWKIIGNTILLTRRRATAEKKNLNKTSAALLLSPEGPDTAPVMLDELLVVSRIEANQIETAEIGAKRLTESDIGKVPVLLGESDVIKNLQMQPGVSSAQEGFAGLNVHGGDFDENLYLLDNVPLYQVNHFGGLLSAFNTDAIRYVDFFKTSIPAQYDGRLSSVLDVKTRTGNSEHFSGKFRLGLTSGALSAEGPIGHRTTYAVALRRSWFEVLSVPLIAIVNSSADSDKIRFGYSFTDINGSINHRFSNRLAAFASFYFGGDKLKTGSEESQTGTSGYSSRERIDMRWGNLSARTGINLSLSSDIKMEATLAYTCFISKMDYEWTLQDATAGTKVESRSKTRSRNYINDLIIRTDFDWAPNGANRMRCGTGYTWHYFNPSK